MAGGKLSARQKMINLMYLVFIAMLALNMSKEVLSAFGLMNEKLTESNQAATERNEAFMQGLAEKVSEQPAKYQPLKAQADQISTLANNFNSYLEELKGKMTATVDDPQDYEVMDKGDYLDNNFFKGDKLKPEGQEFLNQIKTFREGVIEVLSQNPDMASIADDVKDKFETDPVTNRDGNKVDWLDYHYKGFPLVASLTKMTQLQADVKTTESEVLSSMLAGKLKVEASLTNFDAIVVPDKTAFFSGENFTGRIILGKNDKTLKADKVVINGQELPAESMQAGQTLLDFPAGAVGEREIEGEFQFKEGDSIISIPVKSTYAVVPKPNSATISADKMNVVYRGVANPMTISFAGISDNNVSASAPGLSKGSGVGKYVMNPGSGREVTINVSGTLPDGSKVSDKATFRIKDIPKPTGTISGQDGVVKLPRNSVEIATIGAMLDDFDFELPIQVTSFKIKVPGQPSVDVNGTKLNSQAKNSLRKARRGDAVQIFDIKAQIRGNSSYKLKGVSPVIVEIAN
ncbi:MAG: gliding motility protein GldM [Xanthomarina sp.]|uniref:type IX secretion system motor protein PorM/GldM n=2 Tax=Flavobacteriaceae TaxID=49546 RepID=UPI000C3EE683|nr:gliding motility protein GldM [Xanthomarina sp.]MAL24103.1 gliding motility protein GldM [Xanthomarina sp.]MBF61426.1 gliding motility protein GldM [Xanthomarina sp.]|tara:strand:+ start:2317 stop:3867 length:1551 start_codon:yes stop_codon:yes gene_type:complete